MTGLNNMNGDDDDGGGGDDDDDEVFQMQDGKFDDKLLNMAIKGNADDMLEAARYCEQRPGFEEKAALLYHKVRST